MNDIYDFVQLLPYGQIIVLNTTSKTNLDQFSLLLKDVYEKYPSEIWCLSEDCFNRVDYKNKILLTKDEYIKKIQERYNFRPKKIIGITGSYGKTSTVWFTYFLLKQLGYSVCFAGSAGMLNSWESIENIKSTGLSTMGTAGLYKFIHDNKDCDFAILEISSVAVKQNRMVGIEFNGGIFTAFCEDHLDMHESLEEYFNCKKSFIESIDGPTVCNKNILNIGNESTKYPSENYYITSKGFYINGKNIVVDGIKNPFQNDNILGALTLLDRMGVEFSQRKFDLVELPGRMEYMGKTLNNCEVYIDGAHSSDQVDHFLQSVQANYHNSVIIYGASGKRLKTDLKTKDILEKFDHVIITDDNPCTVDPFYIREQLYKKHFILIANRFEAIKYAINNFTHKTIFILGKSSEVSNIIEYKNSSVFYKENIVVKQLIQLSKITFE